MNGVSVKWSQCQKNITRQSFFLSKKEEKRKKNHLHCLCLIARLKNTFFYTDDDDDMIAVKLESKLHSFRCRFGIQSVVRLWVIVCLAFLFSFVQNKLLLLFKSCFFYTAPLFFDLNRLLVLPSFTFFLFNSLIIFSVYCLFSEIFTKHDEWVYL